MYWCRHAPTHTHVHTHIPTNQTHTHARTHMVLTPSGSFHWLKNTLKLVSSSTPWSGVMRAVPRSGLLFTRNETRALPSPGGRRPSAGERNSLKEFYPLLSDSQGAKRSSWQQRWTYFYLPDCQVRSIPLYWKVTSYLRRFCTLFKWFYKAGFEISVCTFFEILMKSTMGSKIMVEHPLAYFVTCMWRITQNRPSSGTPANLLAPTLSANIISI